MDTVFTASERAALPTQVVHSDFAAAPAMISDCEVSDRLLERILLSNSAWFLMVSSHMPPVPPANRTKKGRGSDPKMSKDTSVKQPEHHHNAAEEGERANIKQNTTNKGFFRGRRLG